MSDHADENRPRIRPSLADLPRPNLGLLVAIAFVATIVSVVLISLGAAHLLVFADLAALYLAMGAFGGTLASDVRNLAATGLFLLLAVGIPTWLSGSVLPLSAAIVVLVVAAASLTGALGSRWALWAQGASLAALSAFTYQHTRGITPVEVFTGISVAFLVVACVRILVGLLNRDGAQREALAAAVLDPTFRNAEIATVVWMRGPALAWSRQALLGVLRYVSSATALRRQGHAVEVATRGHDVAAPVAAEVSTSKGHGEAPPTLAALRGALTTAPGGAEVHLIEALEHIDAAARVRRPGRVRGAASSRRLYARTVLGGAVSPASPYLRHALRLAFALAVAIPIAVLFLPPAFGVGLVLTVYGFLQLSWRGTVTQVRNRLVGVVAGAALGSVASLILPAGWQTPVGIVVLVIGISYAASSITVLMACIVFGLTLMLAPTLDMEPVAYALGYVGTVTGGAILAAVIAFAAVPLQSPASARRAIERARSASADLLETLAAPMSNRGRSRAALIQAYKTNHQILTRRQRSRRSTSGPSDRVHEALADIHFVAFLLVAGIIPSSDLVRRTCHDAAISLRGSVPEKSPIKASDSPADLALLILESAFDTKRQ